MHVRMWSDFFIIIQQLSVAQQLIWTLRMTSGPHHALPFPLLLLVRHNVASLASLLENLEANKTLFEGKVYRHGGKRESSKTKKHTL